MKKIIFLLLVLNLGCTSTTKDNNSKRTVASIRPQQPPLEQGEVWSQDDLADMESIGDIFRDNLENSTGNNPVMRRDAHPKAHGCVISSLEVDNHLLAPNLRVGLFKENQTYGGIVRFSNGNPDANKPDADGDVRGMALKLLSVPYENYLSKIGVEEKLNVHDFVFMNADAFFIDNVSDYNKFMVATKGRIGVLSYLAFHWTSLQRILGALQKPGNPLDLDYRSATPYKLGNTSMKMKFKTCKLNKDAVPSNPSNNFLSEVLASSLKESPACFDFYVQPNLNPKVNNIESATTIWDETKSPFIKVGQLTIKKQVGIRTAEQMKKCEDMTFNPWRAPIENRPLGGVNRVRLEVYLNQSKMRHEYNEARK